MSPKMKFHISSSLFLGLLSILSLYLIDVSAELSAQYYHTQARQTFPLATRDEYVDRDPPAESTVGLASSKLRLFKRGRRWTPEDEELLLELRENQKMSWVEIMDRLDRSYQALEAKHFILTHNPARLRKDMSNKPRKWTRKEEERLLELKETTNQSWAEIAQNFAQDFEERTVGVLQNRYNYLKRTMVTPKKAIQRWTAEEDRYLLQLGNEDIPWVERRKRFDAYFHGTPNNRSLAALKKRYSDLSPPLLIAGKGLYKVEEDDEIVNALNIHMTVEEIAGLLERPRSGIYNRIRKLENLGRLAKAPQIAARRSYTDAELQLIYKLRNGGMSFEDIAAAHFPGRTPDGIRAAYTRHFETK